MEGKDWYNWVERRIAWISLVIMCFTL
jgi:hypothetical protein